MTMYILYVYNLCPYLYDYTIYIYIYEKNIYNNNNIYIYTYIYIYISNYTYKPHRASTEKVPKCMLKETQHNIFGKPKKVYGRTPSYLRHMATKRRPRGDQMELNGVKWYQTVAKMHPQGDQQHFFGEDLKGVRPYTFLSASPGDKRASKRCRKGGKPRQILPKRRFGVSRWGLVNTIMAL